MLVDGSNCENAVFLSAVAAGSVFIAVWLRRRQAQEFLRPVLQPAAFAGKDASRV